MIRLLSERDYREYAGKEGEYTYSLSKMCAEGEVLEELLPSQALIDVWKRSKEDEEVWKCIENVLERRYLTSITVNWLAELSELGRTVNLVCNCDEKEHCIREILYKVFLEKKVEVFLK